METPIEVDVRDGTRLEALLALPESPKAGLVLCHPHPLYGGDMHNPVVVRAGEVAQGLGLATLRFNFRGVGASTGVHDEGKGEQDDVLAALDVVAARLPAGRQVGLAGYSFGSWVSARVVAAGRVGSVEEVAAMVAFLLSDESSYCHGSEFVLDGGYLAGPLGSPNIE